MRGMAFLKWLLNTDIANGVIIMLIMMVAFSVHTKIKGDYPGAKATAIYFAAAFALSILAYRFIINPALRS